MDLACVRKWSEFEIGQTESKTFTVSEEDLEAFAALSGDYNPLHGDREFALKQGFDGRVVYGGLLVAQISCLLGMYIPGRDGVWLSLKIDFRQPLYCGEMATLKASISHLSSATGVIALSLTISTERRVIASGTAECLLKSE